MTRLAPSPTGALHLGNASSFLLCWAIARARGWRVVLRVEDLDGPRIRPGAAQEAIDVLHWLGLDWDDAPVTQSDDLSPYRDAMQRLCDLGVAYPCALSRAQIAAAASAPQHGSGETRCPPDLRPETMPRVFEDAQTSWRFTTPAGEIGFDDAVLGPQRTDPSADVGDFVVWTDRGQPAYQLACVVDDARQGVTDVVRGNDLVSSTGRQRLLAGALGHPAVRYWHLPLIVGPDGRRLAKRHGDSRLNSYRAAGVPPERIIALLARYHRLRPAEGPNSPASLTAEQLVRALGERGTVDGPRFDARRLGAEPIVFHQEDHQWLLDGRH